MALAAAPVLRADQPPATAPATAPSRLGPQDRRKLVELTRRSVEMMKVDKLDAAEDALREALALSPLNIVNLYNMACVKALLGRNDAAMDYLERAASQGFTDFLKIEQDPDLKAVRGMQRYRDLIGRKDELQRRAAEWMVDFLKRDLGKGYLFEIDQQDKLIFATNTDQPTLDVLKQRLIMQARSQWDLLFSRHPEEYISVVLCSPTDFRQIVRQPGVGGFYNRDNRILIAQRMGLIMQHEFTHALHGADLDPTGEEHPTWISEGLATLFENAHFDGPDLVPADNQRLTAIQRAGRANGLIPLARLVAMDQKAFVGNATKAYGQSGSIMLYLYERKLLRKFYDAVKADYELDPTGRMALEQATGSTLVEFEKQWKAWMLARKPPPTNTGANGPVLGVRLADATDGVRVTYVEAGGPAAVAGLKMNDVLVAIDDEDVFDQASLVPLLGMHEAGDQITVKARRAGAYLDLVLTLGRRPSGNGGR